MLTTQANPSYPHSMKRLGALLALFVLTACGSDDEGPAAGTEPPEPRPPAATDLELAATSCGEPLAGNPLSPRRGESRADEFIEVEDEGATLTISGGDQFSTPKIGFCILRKLDAPASTTSKVESTTAMMGQLTDEFEGYEVTWSYHPDTGLKMVVEQSA